MAAEKFFYVVGAPVQVMTTSFTRTTPTGINAITGNDILKSLQSAAWLSAPRMRAFFTLEEAKDFADGISKQQPIPNHYISYTPVVTVTLKQTPHDDVYHSGPQGEHRISSSSFNDISSIVSYFYRSGSQSNPQSSSIELNIPEEHLTSENTSRCALI